MKHTQKVVSLATARAVREVPADLRHLVDWPRAFTDLERFVKETVTPESIRQAEAGFQKCRAVVQQGLRNDR